MIYELPRPLTEDEHREILRGFTVAELIDALGPGEYGPRHRRLADEELSRRLAMHN